MEIVYGIAMLLVFLIGFGIGISVPFFIKKYVETQKPKEIESKEEEKEDKFKYIPNDLLMEWITGEEVKKHDE